MGRYRTVESEKDEQSYEARIWWMFLVVALIVLSYTIWHHYLNYNLVQNGTCIEAQYFVQSNQAQARYQDEAGQIYTYNLSSLNADHDEDTVKLYYVTDIRHAEPKRALKSWLFSYLFFGLMFVGCSFKLYTIYKKKPETTIYESMEE